LTVIAAGLHNCADAEIGGVILRKMPGEYGGSRHLISRQIQYKVLYMSPN